MWLAPWSGARASLVCVVLGGIITLDSLASELKGISLSGSHLISSLGLPRKGPGMSVTGAPEERATGGLDFRRSSRPPPARAVPGAARPGR